MENKKQIVFIHGGDSYASKEDFYQYLRTKKYEPHPEPYQRWRDDVQKKVEAVGHEWLFMEMPNKHNADYEAWKIWFEKVVPFITEKTETHVVGYSLGACFLLRYLSENKTPFIIDALHLVSLCLPQDGENLGSFGVDNKNLPKIAESAAKILLYHSTDDPICPYAHSQLVEKTLSNATLHTFTDRGHFFQPEFPELLECIEGK